MSDAPGPSEPTATKSRPSTTRLALIGAAVLVIVLALVIWGVTASGSGTSQAGSTSVAACPAASVAEDVLPSVVTLSVHGPSGSGTGSGEVIRDGGYILTNNHVISNGVGGSVDVLFSSGESQAASIVGRSIPLDLAVLKVKSSEGLPVIKIGDPDTLRVGQPVVALGAPLGLNGTVTSGIVSALGRQVPVPADNGETAILPGAIQTDAAINPGNSGGALVDCSGSLVGVNTAIATVPNAAGQAGGGSVGIGFAIPSDLAMRVADQLIATGTFEPPSTGVSTLPITPDVAGHFGVDAGLYVTSVEAGGPGAAAGLRPGDVITHVDGEAVAHPISLFATVVTKKPGDTVSIKYVRDGATAQTTLTLGTLQ
ncbi:MAG TPA: trypsin-like peptidase domain-containing protein [Jatrophihabitantaceae bacterium]